MTQRELGIAVGYSEAQIARLERGRRLPDLATIRAQMIPALHLEDEPEVAARLVELAEQARGKPAAPAAPVVAPPEKTSAEAAPVAATAAKRRNNLPAPLTRFIGHARDITEITHLLASNRLVTLTGPGGMGKTRLALQVARAITNTGDYPDGVWLVELAPLVDPTSLVRAVADEFKVADEPCCTPTELLVAYLEPRQLVLILDNCEHLINAAADLTEHLLTACPQLRVLATSREALRIAGEVNWRVPPMTTPDPANPPPLEQMANYEAIQLFVEHAQSAQPGFDLTLEVAPVVAQICYRLDGIPLAIEMAAAQVAVMTPQEIAARLDDRFALLASVRRTALQRQSTLHAALDWSYNLLSEPERLLLARLAVFVNGFTVDAAQAVCGDGTGEEKTEDRGQRPEVRSEKQEARSKKREARSGKQEAGDGKQAAGEETTELVAGHFLPTASVLPLLLQLVNKSLVIADSHEGQTRYRLLETIRQYAMEKLSESGETDRIYERLTSYIISLAVVRASGGSGPPATDLLNRLEAELGNVRALMAWARARPDDGVTSLNLASALSALWVSRGYLVEATVWLMEALARGTAAPTALRVEALNGLLRLLAFRGYNLSPWSGYADEVVRLSEQIDNPIERFEALYWAGYTAMQRMDYPAAQSQFDSALALARGMPYSHGMVVALCGLIWIRLKRGENTDALLTQALELAQEGARRADRARGDASQFDVCSVINNLAAVDLRAALEIGESEVTRLREMERPEELAITLQLFAELLLISADYARAETVLLECLALWRDVGVQWNVGSGTARTMLDLGMMAWLSHDWDSARSWYEQSLELYRHVGDVERVARLHILIGYTRIAKGDLASAHVIIERGLTLYREADQPAGMVLALTALGTLALAQGHAERAARIFGAAAAPRDMLLSFSICPANSVIQNHEIAAARSQLSVLYKAAWEEGMTLTLDQALDYVRETTSQPPRDP
ncbi:MAG: tetratricopeptide repeat protein [Chloroflexi bacterium]|nr:tetratricopeptide repeat protein [Chloroflexota bacterium]